MGNHSRILLAVSKDRGAWQAGSIGSKETYWACSHTHTHRNLIAHESLVSKANEKKKVNDIMMLAH